MVVEQFAPQSCSSSLVLTSSSQLKHILRLVVPGRGAVPNTSLILKCTDRELGKSRVLQVSR